MATVTNKTFTAIFKLPAVHKKCTTFGRDTKQQRDSQTFLHTNQSFLLFSLTPGVFESISLVLGWSSAITIAARLPNNV